MQLKPKSYLAENDALRFQGYYIVMIYSDCKEPELGVGSTTMEYSLNVFHEFGELSDKKYLLTVKGLEPLV